MLHPMVVAARSKQGMAHDGKPSKTEELAALTATAAAEIAIRTLENILCGYLDPMIR